MICLYEINIIATIEFSLRRTLVGSVILVVKAHPDLPGGKAICSQPSLIRVSPLIASCKSGCAMLGRITERCSE